MKIQEKLYWYPYRGFENNCNTCIFDGEMRMLVDPGYLFNLGNLLISIREDGLKVEDIDLLVISHGHPDHCEAMSKLNEIAKAKVAVHKVEWDFMLEYDLFRYVARFNSEFSLGEELDLGGLKLRILRTPGHTPGGISIYWQNAKVLYSGDTVFYKGVGRTDLPGGDIMALKKSVEMLSELDVEYLLPGHHYGFPQNHVGIIKGKENVQSNFKYLLEILR